MKPKVGQQHIERMYVKVISYLWLISQLTAIETLLNYLVVKAQINSIFFFFFGSSYSLTIVTWSYY